MMICKQNCKVFINANKDLEQMIPHFFRLVTYYGIPLDNTIHETNTLHQTPPRPRAQQVSGRRRCDYGEESTVHYIPFIYKVNPRFTRLLSTVFSIYRP